MTTVRAMFWSGRGGRLTSPGIYALTNKLHAAGIDVSFYGPPVLQASLNAQIADLNAAFAGGQKIMLGGYSLGAMTAIEVAKLLQGLSVNVDLLATIVPAYGVVPGNVKEAVNHTIYGGRFFIWPSDRLDSFSGAATALTNIHYRDKNHVTIQSDDRVHTDIVMRARRLSGG